MIETVVATLVEFKTSTRCTLIGIKVLLLTMGKLMSKVLSEKINESSDNA